MMVWRAEGQLIIVIDIFCAVQPNCVPRSSALGRIACRGQYFCSDFFSRKSTIRLLITYLIFLRQTFIIAYT